MKTYLADIIPKIKGYSQKLDNITLLTNQHWVVIDEMSKAKNVYIFRENGELLISQDGRVEKAQWEYLGNNALLIDRKDESYLFRHGFFDENVMALKIDGREEYAFLINETRFDQELNTINNVIDFLSLMYLKPHVHNKIQKKIGPNFPALENKIYKKTQLPTLKPLLGKPILRQSIKFINGQSGTIYICEDNQSYFKSFLNEKYYYKNSSYCINALSHYLKTGEISYEGLLYK